jgi:hypothetical protein
VEEDENIALKKTETNNFEVTLQKLHKHISDKHPTKKVENAKGETELVPFSVVFDNLGTLLPK